MIRSVEITGFQLSIVYLRVVRQAIWELRLTETEKLFIIPSLTVKFIKTPLKALFYLGFSAVSFRFTI